jgi:hypothetical protein
VLLSLKIHLVISSKKDGKYNSYDDKT